MKKFDEIAKLLGENLGGWEKRMCKCQEVARGMLAAGTD